MDSIRQWLNGNKNYNIGLALYQTYGSNDGLKQMFDQGETEYRKKRLIEALTDIFRETPTQTVVIDKKPIVVSTPNEMPENAIPAENDPYRDQWMPLYQRMNYLRHKLTEAGLTDEKRGEYAFEVLKLEKECIHLWAQRGYFIRYNKQPEIIKENVLSEIVDINALRVHLNNARANRSKAKKKMDIDAAAAERFVQYDLQVKMIEEKLGIC